MSANGAQPPTVATAGGLSSRLDELRRRADILSAAGLLSAASRACDRQDVNEAMLLILQAHWCLTRAQGYLEPRPPAPPIGGSAELPAFLRRQAE